MPARNPRYWIIAVAALGIAGLGYVAYSAFRAPAGAGLMGGASGQPGATVGAAGNGGNPGAQRPTGGPPAGGMATSVEVVKVVARAVVEDAGAVGTIRSNESVVLRPEVAGRIAAIHFRDGQTVSRGTVLVALDAAIQQAELQQAKANLALAQTNYRRNEDLFQRKFISERARDESAATLKVQEATVALAEARLARMQVRAPFDGVVGIRNVSVGDYVKDGQELINVEDVATLKVDFRLPEVYLGQIRAGQSVDVSSDALVGETFRATVEAVNPQVDASGRSILVRARMGNPKAKLRPGMFVRVRLTFRERQGVLMLPEQTLVPAGSDQFVFRLQSGEKGMTAQQVKVRTGLRRDGQVEITEGLKAGDVVVTAGQLKLRDGAAVRIVDGAPAAAPAGGAAAPAPVAAAPAVATR